MGGAFKARRVWIMLKMGQEEEEEKKRGGGGDRSSSIKRPPPAFSVCLSSDGELIPWLGQDNPF